MKQIQKKNNGRKKEHYLTIKGSIHQENVRILNVCLPNKSAQEYIKENNRTEGRTDELTRFLGDFNILLPLSDRMSRQKISENIDLTTKMTYLIASTDVQKTLNSQHLFIITTCQSTRSFFKCLDSLDKNRKATNDLGLNGEGQYFYSWMTNMATEPITTNPIQHGEIVMVLFRHLYERYFLYNIYLHISYLYT